MRNLDYSTMATKELDLLRKNLSVKITRLAASTKNNGPEMEENLRKVTAICQELKLRKAFP